MLKKIDKELIKAVKAGNLEAVKEAFKNGARINTHDTYWQTPLHWAIVEGHSNIAEFLVEQKANINAKDGNKWTPLILAAYKGNLKIVEYLVEKGANVNIKDMHGHTPLYWVLDLGNKDITVLLLKHEANPYIKNNQGKNAINYIKESDRFTDQDKEDLIELINAIYKPYIEGAVNGMVQASNPIDSTESVFPISQLPKDILNVIAGFIDPYTAGRLTKTCKAAYNQANNNYRNKLDEINKENTNAIDTEENNPVPSNKRQRTG